MAATLALNDYEFYVQASALQCVGAAAKIPNVWEGLRKQFPDVQVRFYFYSSIRFRQALVISKSVIRLAGTLNIDST